MRRYHLVDAALKNYYWSVYKAKGDEGNFGYWCLFDENLFCQEREGCQNCAVRLKR